MNKNSYNLSFLLVSSSLISLILLPIFLFGAKGYIDMVFIPFFVVAIFSYIGLLSLKKQIPEGHYSKEHLIVGKEYKVLTRHFCKDWVENKLKTKCHAVISDGKANVYHLVIDDESEKFPEEGKKFFLNSGGKIIELQEN